MIVRGLLGLSLAGFPVAALAYLREEVLASDHLRTNAAYIAGTALGGAVGRLLPGPLAELGGWPLASLVMSGITLSAGLALVVLLPASRRFQPHRPSTREVLLGVVSAPRDPVVALLCVAAFVANGTFVGVYNAIGFRLQAPPFSLGVAASLLYLAYPIGIAAPGVARRLADRTGRGLAAVITFAALGVAVVAISLPSLVAMFVGLGAVTFVFLGLHSLLSGWVVDRARRRGRGTAQASSAYLLAFYTGSTLAGALATSLWASSGWLAVEVMGLVLCTIGVGVPRWPTRPTATPSVQPSVPSPKSATPRTSGKPRWLRWTVGEPSPLSSAGLEGAEPEAESSAGHAEHQHPGGVDGEGQPALRPAQPDGLDRGGREGGVATQEAGADQLPDLRVAAVERPHPDQQAQGERAGDVDHRGAEQQASARGPMAELGVHDEPDHRTEPAGQRHQQPDHRRPPRNQRTGRRTARTPTKAAATPSSTLPIAYPSPISQDAEPISPNDSTAKVE